MNGIAGWITPETMRWMGISLLHFLWQGAAIAAVGFLAMSAARRASTKHAIGVAALVAMMAAPTMTFWVLRQRSTAVSATRFDVGPYSSTSSMRASVAAGPTAPMSLAPGEISTRLGSGAETKSSMYLLWFVEVWFLGVMLLSLRPAAGFLLIERLRLKQGRPVMGALRARCLDLQRRIGLNRVIRYCESMQLASPAVVGWFRPVVMLPMAALTGLTTQQLEAVIAHELAHVKRLDPFVNLFQIAAETLLFYHPAVWWMSRCVRAERENCCDDVAMEVCGNAVEYARALATMAEWQSAPAMAMAANRSPLAERVARLLGANKFGGGVRSASVAASVVCLCASIFAGNALIGAAQTNRPSDEQQPAPEVQPVPERDAVIVVRPKPKVAVAPRVEVNLEVKPVIDPETGIVSNAEMEGTTEGALAAVGEAYGESVRGAIAEGVAQGQEAPEKAQQSERKERRGSYIEGLKAEGVTDVSVSDLIAMKVQGVTPEYVHSIHALGLQPTVNELIAMKVQGVTPDLIRELKVTGLALEINQLIAMQVQGVTPAYVRQFHDLFGATDANQLVAMKVQGIDGDYVRAMREAIGEKLNVSEMVAMKVQGVTPEYVRDMKGLGFQISGDDIIGMKVQGVTPEYVKSMQAAGFKLDEHSVVKAKVMGVTPEFAEKARKHGFQNMSIDKLIALKNAGVLD